MTRNPTSDPDRARPRSTSPAPRCPRPGRRVRVPRSRRLPPPANPGRRACWSPVAHAKTSSTVAAGATWPSGAMPGAPDRERGAGGDQEDGLGPGRQPAGVVDEPHAERDRDRRSDPSRGRSVHHRQRGQRRRGDRRTPEHRDGLAVDLERVAVGPVDQRGCPTEPRGQRGQDQPECQCDQERHSVIHTLLGIPS